MTNKTPTLVTMLNNVAPSAAILEEAKLWLSCASERNFVVWATTLLLYALYERFREAKEAFDPEASYMTGADMLRLVETLNNGRLEPISEESINGLFHAASSAGFFGPHEEDNVEGVQNQHRRFGLAVPGLIALLQFSAELSENPRGDFTTD